MKYTKIFLFAFLLLLCMLPACAGQEKSSDMNRNKVSSPSGISEKTPAYRYDFLSQNVILRNENYTDILWADAIPENEREECGFWPITNSEECWQYKTMVFRINGIHIVRYDSKGSRKELFKSDGDLKLIACEDNSLYFYNYNYDTKMESYYRINDCLSDGYTIDCIAELPTASDTEDNLNKPIIKNGEWIYFLYTDQPGESLEWYKNPEIWLYRLSEKTGETERVESVFRSMFSQCQSISDISQQGDILILEGVPQNGNLKDFKNRCSFLYDYKKDVCTLLCDSTVANSDCMIVDEVYYHRHIKEQDQTVTIAKKVINSSDDCISFNTQLSKNTAAASSISNLDVYGNSIIYFAYSSVPFHSDGAESWYGCCADISQEKTALEFLSIFSKPVYSYYNGIIYMYINGAVVYSDAVTPGTWYDTGIRYASIDYGQAFFEQEQGKVYFVTVDANKVSALKPGEDITSINLNDVYKSTLIELDFSVGIPADSPIFKPNAAVLAPVNRNGTRVITSDWHDVKDIYGNYYSPDYDSHNNPAGPIQFMPVSGENRSIQYKTNEKYKYMSGIIGVSEWSLASGQLKFYADENLVYETPIMRKESAPIVFSIDISNAKTVTVEAVSEDGYSSMSAVTSAELILDDVIFHDLDVFPYNRWLKSEMSESEKDVTESPDPIEESIYLDRGSLNTALTEYTWESIGYRLSDTWDFKFYDTGQFSGTNAAGAEPIRGTYVLEGTLLSLLYGPGQEASEYRYDETQQAFISTTDQTLVKQDYMDESGIYHEPVYEYRKLVPQK